MASNKTSEEVRAHHLDELGPELGPIFNALWNDLAWLRVKWGEYRELFGTSEERIHLLNSATGLFFGMLQGVLWEGTLLHLCRLTDPAKVAGKSTVTVQALPELCQDKALRVEVSGRVEAAVEATKFARDWRNRVIAHRELELAQQHKSAKALARASRVQVSAALSAIHGVLNHISETLLGSTLADEVASLHSGSIALLHVIKDGLETADERRKRIRNGQPEPRDLKARAI
jgi:hypothetical protein